MQDKEKLQKLIDVYNRGFSRGTIQEIKKLIKKIYGFKIYSNLDGTTRIIFFYSVKSKHPILHTDYRGVFHINSITDFENMQKEIGCNDFRDNKIIHEYQLSIVFQQIEKSQQYFLNKFTSLKFEEKEWPTIQK